MIKMIDLVNQALIEALNYTVLGRVMLEMLPNYYQVINLKLCTRAVVPHEVLL
ncbi:hypothetical protein [Legionella norrlandica]|uniref:hypothetical protein n=1 Tax=Legionella norrlandica TaxID=1498499 RepID=UPI000AC4E181|nr:hypothetical protein [Legionella norrlandica]